MVSGSRGPSRLVSAPAMGELTVSMSGNGSSAAPAAVAE